MLLTPRIWEPAKQLFESLMADADRRTFLLLKLLMARPLESETLQLTDLTNSPAIPQKIWLEVSYPIRDLG
jgi:hypothetical protein